MKYAVEPEALKAGADRVVRALETLGTVRIDEDLRPLHFGFAGGVTAAGLKAITNQWDAQLAGARARLRDLGSALDEAWAGYRGLESHAVQQFGAPGTGAP